MSAADVLPAPAVEPAESPAEIGRARLPRAAFGRIGIGGWRLIALLGPTILIGAALRLLSIDDVLERAGRRLGVTIRAVRLSDPLAAIDVDSIEAFLQDANVRYVILDEIHKVVEDLQSVSNDVTRRRRFRLGSVLSPM